MRTPPACAVIAFLLAALPACERENRRFKNIAAASQRSEGKVLSDLRPGVVPDKRSDMGGSPYQGNAWAVNEGKRLYAWFNCTGCHAHGGGSIGPPLMDEKWIYGKEPENIFASIVEGRPNGMPSFRGKIPDDQVWQLVAYVQSLAGVITTDVAPGRDDSMSYKRSEQLEPKKEPKPGPPRQP
jgi:cytochrome c oxidase cbb3-type subunit III